MARCSLLSANIEGLQVARLLDLVTRYTAQLVIYPNPRHLLLPIDQILESFLIFPKLTFAIARNSKGFGKIRQKGKIRTLLFDPRH